MGVIIVIAIAIISCIIWYLIEKKCYYDTYLESLRFSGYLSVASIVVFTVSIIVSISSLINIDRKFNSFIFRYNATKEAINYSRVNMSDLERVKVITDIAEINTEIADHRAYVGNFWSGIWYSEEIANLEYLK